MEENINEKIDIIQQILKSYNYFSQNGEKDNSIKQFARPFVEGFQIYALQYGVSHCLSKYERVARTDNTFGMPIYNRSQLYRLCLKQIMDGLTKPEKEIVKYKIMEKEPYNAYYNSLLIDSENSISKIIKKIKSLKY